MQLNDEDLDMPPKLNPCRSCGKDKVVKPGDYCRECAVDFYAVVSMDKYIIVEPLTMADTAEKTGVDWSFLKAKYEQLNTLQCHYVLFQLNGKWADIVVDKHFYLPRVMQTVFEKYS